MTKEQADIIREALDWIACFDERFVEKMEEARERALMVIERLESDED